MSSPEECSAFFGSCSATPADHGASAVTCVKIRQRRLFTVSSGTSETVIEARIGLWRLDYTFRFPILRLTIIREAVFSVSSFLHRDRVMEARFDSYNIQLPNRVRAIGGVMFCREAWVVRSRLYTETCFRLMPYSQGDPPGRGRFACKSVGHEMVPSPAARCMTTSCGAEDIYSGNAQRFLPISSDENAGRFHPRLFRRCRGRRRGFRGRLPLRRR